MTDTTFIPDYLKPALERLAAARAAHLEQARLMEDTSVRGVSGNGYPYRDIIMR